jgi:hypothetical protein
MPLEEVQVIYTTLVVTKVQGIWENQIKTQLLFKLNAYSKKLFCK